ncbi:aldo/keto reductase [Natrinema versiforme]|uniref:Aldo/keto reductase n=1 Tax=Natrinema versiforme TaxID=88724 RepID=A0A4P8WM66_9EURY|nr:aldo/keto reductase [Natrinema versiforme]QCS44590.1 aldo/keto reductase [Natrinema versiforme]
MEYVSVQGADIPALGFGTARMGGTETRNAVETALRLGYRHIDTAQMYGNEDAVGEAVENADVARDEVFVVTKILRRNLAYDDLQNSFEDSLDRLKMEYVDLLLIHEPSQSVPVTESVRAMNELQEAERVQHIGVSNFSLPQLQEAEAASDTPIVTNQVEYHPFTDQSQLLEYCVDNDVMLTAYSPLAVGRRLENETLIRVGKRYGKSPAQVVLRWLIQQENVSAIPKASKRQHQEENIEIFDFELTTAEMDAIFDL